MKSFSQFLIENEVAESFGGYIVESEIDPLTGQIVSRRGEAAKFQSKVEKEIKNKTNKNKFVKGQTTGTQTPKRGATTIRTSNQLDLFTKKVEPPKEVPVKTTYKTRVNKPKVSSDPTIPGINNVSNTKNIVDKDKFSDVRKFQDLNKRAKEILNKSNNTVSNVSNQNKINKIPQNEVKPVKISNVIKDVNTKPIRNVKLPDIKPNTSSLNFKNNIRTPSLPNFVSTKTPRGNIVTSNLSNYKDPEVEKIIKDAENLKNPKSLKAYKQAKKDFKTFIKNPEVIKKVSPFVKAASGVAAAVDGRSDYKASRDMGYNKAQSVARAVTMGLGKYIGGTKGAILGGKFGLVGAIPGGMAGYHYGGKGAEYAFDSLVSTKGRKKLKKNFTNFMDNVRGKK